MESFEDELKRIEKFRKESEVYIERQSRLKEREYRRLSWLAMGVTLIAAVEQYITIHIIHHVPAHWMAISGSITVGGMWAILCYAFLLKAHRSPLGIGGYLKIEKRLFIDEMPNIFQILSLLGFLNVLLKQEAVKVVVTIVLTFLLLIYLTSKRREMIARSSKLESQISISITTILSVVLGSIIGLTVYGLASLISVQIR